MSFQSWLLKRQGILPPSDRLIALIRTAGQNGIAEGELRSQVDLPKKLVDELLQALISAAQVSVAVRDGKRVYFSRS